MKLWIETRVIVAALAAVWMGGCAPKRQAWSETVQAEVFVEVLPRSAELWVDGAPQGPGSRTVRVPDAAHVYAFRAAAPGFSVAEQSGAGAQLMGGHVGLVLRPDGFGEARPLDIQDGASLARAAALLQRRGRSEQALEYAERAVEVSPEVPLGHRVMGEAALALGRQKQAIQGYSGYLQLAPDAPDRAAVERQVERLRGDLTIPGRRP
jgi:tetratricopeptide (TPR) repeat protein